MIGFDDALHARPLQLGDDVGVCLSDAWNFRKPLFLDQTIERGRARCETIGGPGVGAPTWPCQRGAGRKREAAA